MLIRATLIRIGINWYFNHSYYIIILIILIRTILIRIYKSGLA